MTTFTKPEKLPVKSSQPKALAGAFAPSATTLGPLAVSIRMAWTGLLANKLRALLTMLGIIIGVGAVIIAIAIGEGSKQAVLESVQRLGTNTLTIIPGSMRRGMISFGFGSRSTLKLSDAEAIIKNCPSVARVSPGVSRSAQVKYANKNNSITVQGSGPDYPLIQNHRVRYGKFITNADVISRRRVAVMGSGAAKDLFDHNDPIGKTIRVAGQNFEVIGVMKKKGGMGFQNPDDAIYVPISTAMSRLFGMTNVSNISVQAKTFALLKKAQTEVETELKKRHKIASGADNDFMIFNQADLADAQNEQQNTFGGLIKYLAIVSLFVGGIGIMNIMLVSVTERTREIGIRKAIGALRSDILTQFLLEALFLSLVGGLIGVAFGIGGSTIVGKLNNWRVVIQPTTVALAFSFSALVGVFFGFYPAFKASRLRPIDALRSE